MRRVLAALCASLLVVSVPAVGSARPAHTSAGPGVPARTDLVHAPAKAVASVKPSRLRFVGTLIIPRLRLRAPIYSGNTDAVFDVGLGHWPGTAIPGRQGNSVIGGHRTGGQMHFLNIHKLRKGDRISARIGRKTFNYRVNSIRIVRPTATNIVKRSRDTRLTLYTCHPPNSIKFRYVVTAVLIR